MLKPVVEMLDGNGINAAAASFVATTTTTGVLP
jgi:hypothetical protein